MRDSFLPIYSSLIINFNNYLNIDIKEIIMTQERLSVADILRISEFFEKMSSMLSHKVNPLPFLHALIEILKKSEHFKEVVEDLENLVSVLERQNDEIIPGADVAYSEVIQRNRGRAEEILKNCFDLKEL